MIPTPPSPPLLGWALPGWFLLFPREIAGLRWPRSSWIWFLIILGVGPALSSAAVSVTVHRMFQTNAILIPSESSRIAINSYKILRPLFAPVFSFAQCFILGLILRALLSRQGLELSRLHLIRVLGLCATPLLLKHIIAALFRLSATSLQDLTYYPTSFLSLSLGTRYDSISHLLLARMDVTDLWSLFQLHAALLALSGGDRLLARQACRWTLGLVLAGDALGLLIIRSWTSLPVLEFLVQILRPTLETLYHM